jgi:methylmalonyl-CoA mutase N-terminal domain/subunit
LRTHAQTAGVSLMAQQPLNNVVRTTMQALAAVLGGTQSLHTNSYDETYALPTEDAAELALRTQQIIYEESGVAQVADPLAGSYFVETLTDQIEAAAWEYIHKIDAIGGIVKAVEEGYPQREIARSAFEYQRDIDTGRRPIVGVNKYTKPGEEAHIPTLKIEHATETGQMDRIRAFRTAREPAAVERALAGVRAALRDDRQNVMPPILDAVKQHATLGEICDLFRAELGEYRDPAYL